MRKISKLFISATIILNLCAGNAFAASSQNYIFNGIDTSSLYRYSYSFESGADSKDTFGVSTQTDAVARNTEIENIRRNKDAALLPPSYGVFSGEIPTNASSNYHSNVKPDYAGNVTNTSTTSSNSSTANHSAASYLSLGSLPSGSGLLAPTSTMADINALSGVAISQEANAGYLLTQASLYADGSLGTINIPKLNRTVTVFEGETSDNMRAGVGHFEFSSVWDGNVSIAGHNRGSSAYLNGIWNLQNGDEIIYTTKYGERVYKVFSIEKISDTDYSLLGWSEENIITLITCVENQPDMRWCVRGIAAGTR